MSPKKKFDLIDKIVRNFADLKWSDQRCSYYLKEFSEVGPTYHGDYYGYDFELGLKDASLGTLEEILRDLGDEIVLENILPRDWNQRDEVLKNTRFVRIFISHLDEQRESAQSLSEFLSRQNMRCSNNNFMRRSFQR